MDPIEIQLMHFKEYLRAYWDLLPKQPSVVDKHTLVLPTELCGDRGILTREGFFELANYIRERSGSRGGQGLWDFSKAWSHWESILRNNWISAATSPVKK